MSQVFTVSWGSYSLRGIYPSAEASSCGICKSPWEGVMREHSMASSPLSRTFVISRKTRIYVNKLTWLIVGKKDDSLMLLGLLADYSGRKKKKFRSLWSTVHPDPSQRRHVAVLEHGKSRAHLHGFKSRHCHLCDLGQVTSLLYASIFLICKMGLIIVATLEVFVRIKCVTLLVIIYNDKLEQYRAQSRFHTIVSYYYYVCYYIYGY